MPAPALHLSRQEWDTCLRVMSTLAVGARAALLSQEDIMVLGSSGHPVAVITPEIAVALVATWDKLGEAAWKQPRQDEARRPH